MIYEGPKQINSDPLIAFDFDRLTSLEATIVNNYIVILSGTADGKIKKVLRYEKKSFLKKVFFFSVE